VFVFRVLPFGLSSAPWAFSRVMKPIKKSLRMLGVTIFSFLDDFLILAVSREHTILHMTWTLELMQRLGLRINWGKSSLEPSQRLEFLGVLLDLKNLTLSLPVEKVNRIEAIGNSGKAW
ncbi:unnamed protein product, partial [Meganyctiphanes norvegica]